MDENTTTTTTPTVAAESAFHFTTEKGDVIFIAHLRAITKVDMGGYYDAGAFTIYNAQLGDCEVEVTAEEAIRLVSLKAHYHSLMMHPDTY